MSEEQVNENKEEQASTSTKTSSGLDQNVAGLLTYVLWFITGIIFLVLEKENRFVKFHALQSIFVSVGLAVLYVISVSVPILGWFVGIILMPVQLILWILLMVKAYQGEYFKLPWIGDMVEKQLDNK
ncbi:DUF4870 domain-containing protein [Gracilibacillus massiliensis]|uniref:DUF4870 domain-containing protein n=1 Tax=Gracilibacillus massiliensis TaxID=1564956 RepID=UPI00071D782F|nr:DUF4870 domain-containing protein [Gracilibacillus massiliensis]